MGSSNSKNGRKVNRRETTPLHVAISRKQISEALDLIKERRFINSKDEMRMSPLCIVISFRQIDLIKPLLDAGANPNSMSLQNATPLMMLVSCDVNRQAFNILLDHFKSNIDYNPTRKDPTKLNINKRNIFGETALHRSISSGNIYAIRKLLKLGADVNASTEDGVSPLQYAIQCGSTKIVRYLYSKGAQVKYLYPPNFEFILPRFILSGCNDDEIMRYHESKFGGVLWGNSIEPFFTPKKPLPLLAVELNLRLIRIRPTDGSRSIKFTYVRGFISSVLSSSKFIATVQGLIPGLEGEWEAILEFDSTKELPWILTSFRKQTDSSLTFENLQSNALKQIEKNGRRIAAKLNISQIPLISIPA